MTNKISRKVLLAASVMLCSSISWGQQRLIASIPFEFRSPVGHLTAGHYEIVAGSGATGGVMTFRNLDSKKTVMVLSGGRVDDRDAPSIGTARLMFRCNGSDCSLFQIWPGYGNDGWWFIQPQKPPVRNVEMATVSVPAFVSNKK